MVKKSREMGLLYDLKLQNIGIAPRGLDASSQGFSYLRQNWAEIDTVNHLAFQVPMSILLLS